MPSNIVVKKKGYGIKYIADLTITTECKSWTKTQPLTCHCFRQLTPPMITKVKLFFNGLLDSFWDQFVKDPKFDRKSAAQIAMRELAEFLVPYSTHLWLKNKPTYIFEIVVSPSDTINLILCLPSVIRIFGLTLETFKYVKAEHTRDQKRLNLNLLNCAKEKYTNTREMGRVYKALRETFGQSLVIASEHNKRGKRIIEEKIGLVEYDGIVSYVSGKLVHLDEAQLQAVRHIMVHHATAEDDLLDVANGGVNMKFGPPSGIKPWNGFGANAATQPLHDFILSTARTLWRNGPSARRFAKYRVVNLYSRMTEENPNGMPQNFHVDFDEGVLEATYKAKQIMPLIAFTPMSPDGCMLAVITRKYAKYQPDREKKQWGGQYFIYIPFGVMLFLPGNAVHAGSFCFGKSLQELEVDVPDYMADFRNARLHFFVCPNKMCEKDADADQNVKHDKAGQHGKKKTQSGYDLTRVEYADKGWEVDLARFSKIKKAILAELSDDEEEADQGNEIAADDFVVNDDDDRTITDYEDYSDDYEDRKMPAKRAKK